MKDKIQKFKKPLIVLGSIGALLFIGYLAYMFFFHQKSNIEKFCAGEILIPFQEKENGKWGFMDYEGEVIIDTEFKERPSMAIDGVFLASKTKKNKTKFQFYSIDDNKTKEQGNKWDRALNFSDGFAAVRNKDEKVKFINAEFKVAFSVEAEEVGSFYNGLAKFKNSEEKWGFIDNTGKVKIKPKYDDVSSFGVEEYTTVSIVEEGEDGEEAANHYSIIDLDGNEILKLKDKYDYVGPYREELIQVRNTDEKSGELEIGFINIEGEKIIKMKEWQSAYPFINGYCTFMEDGEWGLIDAEGEKVISAKYSNALINMNNKIWVKENVDDSEENDNRKWGLIDKNGEKLIDYDYKEYLPFYCNTTIAKRKKKWVFIDDEGEEINDNDFFSIYVDESLLLNFANESTLTSDYFNIEPYKSIINIKEMANLTDISGVQDFFAGGENNNESIFPENNYISYERVGDYDNQKYRFYSGGRTMSFNWYEGSENEESNQNRNEVKYKSKTAPKNISSINVKINYNDYLLVSKNMSESRATEFYQYDDETKKSYLKKNSNSKITRLSIDINTNGKGIEKTSRIAQAIASKYKTQMNISESDWETATENENGFYISGEVSNYNISIQSPSNGIVEIVFERNENDSGGDSYPYSE